MAIKNKVIQNYIKNKEFVGIELAGEEIVVGNILDIDLDWLTLYYEDKKRHYKKTVLVRTDFIKSIEPTSFQRHIKMQKEQQKMFERYNKKSEDTNYVG